MLLQRRMSSIEIPGFRRAVQSALQPSDRSAVLCLPLQSPSFPGEQTSTETSGATTQFSFVPGVPQEADRYRGNAQSLGFFNEGFGTALVRRIGTELCPSPTPFHRPISRFMSWSPAALAATSVSPCRHRAHGPVDRAPPLLLPSREIRLQAGSFPWIAHRAPRPPTACALNAGVPYTGLLDPPALRAPPLGEGGKSRSSRPLRWSAPRTQASPPQVNEDNEL